MAFLRALGSPTISSIINIVAILILSFTVLQNQVSLHDRAAHQSIQRDVSDLPGIRPLRSDRGPISLTIPQGKSVARPAARLSEEEDSKIARSHYGGKGDQPHLGEHTIMLSFVTLLRRQMNHTLM